MPSLVYCHWGIYSVPAFGSEWYSHDMYISGSNENTYHLEKYGPLSKFGYKDFIPEFTGEKFDADVWAELFAKAGARFTVKGDTLYAIFLGWPGKEITVKSLPKGKKLWLGEINKITLLGDPKPLKWTQNENGLTVILPDVPTVNMPSL
jgi:hypothetical protein